MSALAQPLLAQGLKRDGKLGFTLKLDEGITISLRSAWILVGSAEVWSRISVWVNCMCRT